MIFTDHRGFCLFTPQLTALTPCGTIQGSRNPHGWRSAIPLPGRCLPVALDVYKEWLGIPEGPRPPDHYSLLRLVQFEDGTEKIRKNYKKLNAHVRKYATGQYSDQSQTLLNELAKAMLCLTDAESKKDYDRSLGRVIDDRDEKTGRRPLTAFLQDEGIISPAQAKEAVNHAERTGLSLRDSVVQLKYADSEQATRAYANEWGRSYVDLNDMIPEEAALDTLPKAVVRRYTCLPLFIDNEHVLIACSDEPSHELEEEVRLRFGLPLRCVFATPSAIKENIDRYYAAGMRKEKVAAPKKTSLGTKVVEKASAPKEKTTYTDDELAERKKLGIILICFTFVILGNLDTFVLYDRYWKNFMPEYFPWFSTVVLGGPIMAVLYFTYIQKKK
jgi:hypothetical protein